MNFPKSCRHRQRLAVRRTDGRRRLPVVALQQPMGVVTRLELQQREAQLFHRVEVLKSQQLFLQRAHETRGHAVALWRPDKAWPGLNSKEAKFPLEMPAHVLGAVIVANHQPLGDAVDQRAKVLPNPLGMGSKASKRVPGRAA